METMVKEQRTPLTNEELCGLFPNPFELVNHAINLAKRLIKSGHTIQSHPDMYNQASEILLVIVEQRDPLASATLTATEPLKEESAPLSYERPKHAEEEALSKM
jgi:hypothetical protein